MTTPRADDRRRRSASPASEGLPTVASAPQTGATPALEIACPVCATFNSPLCRYCPQCGHLLRAGRLSEHTPVQAVSRQPGSRWLVCLLWLVVVIGVLPTSLRELRFSRAYSLP